MPEEVTKPKSKPVSFSVPEAEYEHVKATAEECETDVAGISKALFNDAVQQSGGSLRAAYAAALARRASALAGSTQGIS